jgi:hypothetical protein
MDDMQMSVTDSPQTQPAVFIKLIQKLAHLGKHHHALRKIIQAATPSL